MFRLLRTLCTLIGFIVLLLIGAYFVREALSKKLMEWGVYHLTSFPFFVSESKIPNQLPVGLTCRNLLLKNPVDFPHPQAALISQMELRLAEKPWNQSQIQVAFLSLKIDELILVKTSNAGNNFSRLIQTSRNSSPLFDLIQIQHFELSLDQVIYYDYTKTSAPLPVTYHLKTEPFRFDQSTTLRQISTLILDSVNQQIALPLGDSSSL